MDHKKYSLWFAATSLVLSILACNLGSPAAPQDTPATQAATESPASDGPPISNAAAQEGCMNPYMPVIAGASWNYNLQGSVPDTYTHTILSVDNDGFVEQDVFASGVTRQAEWKCESGNLTALNPPGGTSGTVTTEGVEANFQTTALEGVTVPAVINPGDTWTQSITLEGTETINGLEIPAKNQFTSNCTAIVIESVTVPAGIFDALRVDCIIDMNITITMGGSDIQTPINFTSSSWYALKVGLVKNVGTGSLDSTTELVSFTLP